MKGVIRNGGAGCLSLGGLHFSPERMTGGDKTRCANKKCPAKRGIVHWLQSGTATAASALDRNLTLVGLRFATCSETKQTKAG